MFKTWMLDALTRAFPLVPGGGEPTVRRQKQSLYLAKGERGAVQLCYWFDGVEHREVDVRITAPAGLKVTARRVGCVPMTHHNTQTPLGDLDGVGHIPGLVPDVLWPDTAFKASPNMVNAYWLSVEVPSGMRAGSYEVTAELLVKDQPAKAQQFTVNVAKLQAKPRQDFHVTHWFYADSLLDWYKLEAWEEKFWPLFDKYVRHFVGMGNDTLYVPIFTPPLDGVKKPTQLLDVRRAGKGKYTFDWTNVDRWINQARKAGIKRFEWTHLFSQWGVAHALRIYEKKGGKNVLLWEPETPATGKVYRQFLEQFLPELKKYLTRRKLMGCSMFHVSDEPHKEHLPAYQAAREMLRELAPWMTVHDALSNIEFAQYVDMPIPIVNTAVDFKKAGIPSWCYYCCVPRGRYVNRLLDTPLSKVQIQGWLFYRFGMKGFLHWGYNYWYIAKTTDLINPFLVTEGGRWPIWAHGDTTLVYPGPDGPISSIRAEIFAMALQDFALLQTLGVNPDDRRLQVLENFADFPRDHDWTQKFRRQLLKGK